MGEERGRIAFFTTYRPPVALDIYSCPLEPTTFKEDDERKHTDGESYNSNAQAIPRESLELILKTIRNSSCPERASVFTEACVDSGRVSGFVYVSESTNNLETLQIALSLDNQPPKSEHVFNFAEIYRTFNGVRMEDSGCIAGEARDYLVYVTTMDAASHRRQPWTTVYKTCLRTGKTDRLTPSYQADLSPSVSPSGKKIAVASLQKRGGWYGEREKLKTDIFLMNLHKPYNRKLLIKDAAWPSWGSETVIFFHRKQGDYWGVFRADVSTGRTFRVTPKDIDAITPAAIDADSVAVATIRKKSELKKFTDSRKNEQYRQIEVFDWSGKQQTLYITANITPLADHFNPFVIQGHGGETRIGYNRCKKRGTLKSGDDVPRQFDQLQSKHSKIGLFRVSGVFPSFSSDGSKLAFVDNDFKAVWLVDDKPLRKFYQMNDNKVFSPVWSPKKDSCGRDVLYVCFGPSFSAKQNVDICSIAISSTGKQRRQVLTKGFNNAFPSANPEGTKLVFRSTRHHHGSENGYKNLYLMKDAERGDFEEGNVERLTKGDWIDTHCKWSPNNDWIVFSSNRDIPKNARKGDEDLDSGYFSIYLVNMMKRDVVVRVMTSGSDLSGHVTHPFFSPDGRSIVVTSDIAAISADPMSLPLYLHSARPYGDIFTVDIDINDMSKNKDLEKFTRITHSRYENATGTWTKPLSYDVSKQWNQHIKKMPLFSSAPWLSTEEKVVVGVKISTAAATMLMLFPFASVALLGFVLLSAIHQRIEYKSLLKDLFKMISISPRIISFCQKEDMQGKVE